MIKVGPDIFNGWEKVFLGHYHAQQKLSDSVEYVGSPLQLSFGEAFQDKNIVIYNFENNKCTYIKNDFSPKHFILNEDELDNYSLEGNFVRLEVKDISSSSMLEVRKNLIEDKKVATMEIKQSIKKEELPIEVETTDEDIFQPKMVDEIEKEKKNKLVEASPDRRTSNLAIDINRPLDDLTKSCFPDVCISGNIQTPQDANWLTSVGNEVTGKIFIPPPSTNVVVPYESESQTNHNFSDANYLNEKMEMDYIKQQLSERNKKAQKEVQDAIDKNRDLFRFQA
jgi:hypothetical protein